MKQTEVRDIDTDCSDDSEGLKERGQRCKKEQS